MAQVAAPSQLTGSADPEALDKLVNMLQKHDRRGDGTISHEELKSLLRALDSTGYWTDARLQVLFQETGTDPQDPASPGRINFVDFVRALYAEAAAAAVGVDFEAVRADLRRVMEQPDWDDGSYAPLLIRLGWHSSGTFNKYDGTGGSNGATMRHALEGGDPDNNGLGKARAILEPIQARYPGLTHADLWILAAYVAIEHTGGPRIRFTGGRTDAGPEKAVAPGRLPNPEKGLPDGFELDEEGRIKGWEGSAQHVRDVFGRMGFGDQEMVALLCGGHVYGRCHNEHSGYAGAWVENPTFFSNEYAADMIGDKWIAVMHDTRMPDGGLVPEEVRPSPGKRQYIDLSKYEGEEDEKEARAAPDAAGYPPGQYRCVSQWVNCREQPDVSSSIVGRFVQDQSIPLLAVKVFGTAVRGMAACGGWVSIIGSAGKTLFERTGDLDTQALAGRYRVIAPGGAPAFADPTQPESDVGRLKAGLEFSCSGAQICTSGEQAGSLFVQLALPNNAVNPPPPPPPAGSWVLIHSLARGAVAELIMEGYNEQPRRAIKGQTGHQMMLVTDMVLLWDESFKKHLQEYADDEDKLKQDFGEAYRRLTELGCPWSADKPGSYTGPPPGCPVSGAATGVCPAMG